MIEFRKGKYRARFYAGCSFPKLSKTFQTRKEAESWLKMVEAQKTLGLLVSKENRLLYNDLVREWFQTEIQNRLSSATQSTYKTSCRKFFLPNLADKYIQDITPQHCDIVYRQILNANLSPKTVNRSIILFKQIFNYSVKRDYLIKNPARNLQPLKVPPPKDVFMSNGEVNLLLNKSKNEWFYSAIVIALNTGMRLGEIAGLHWDMVDFDRKMISVSRNQTKEGLNEFTKTNIKKDIPMTNSLYAFLLNHRKTSKLLSKYVVIDINGNHISPDHFTSHIFKPFLKSTKLDKYRFHDLRHTFASHYMMNGGNLFDLQKFLGHTDIKMTQRYAHLCPDYLHDKIQIIKFI